MGLAAENLQQPAQLREAMPLSELERSILVGAVLGVIGSFVLLFGGDPDFLGVNNPVWDAAALQQFTAGQAKQSGTLKYGVDDDSGEYTVTYTVFRDQPV